MKINIEEAISFLDNPEKSDSRQATSIISIIGEDLNTYAFKHYLENNENAHVEILSCSVTTGKNKGKRLDRWICVERNGTKILYQCEIKNWGATAIGGKRLEKNANNDSKLKVAEINWKRQLNEAFSKGEYPNGVTKVFVKMKPPKEYEGMKVEPLILYWMPLANIPKLNPLFKTPILTFNNQNIKTEFTEINIFSVSLYLRSLLENGTKEIELDMPNVKRRLEILDKICPK